MIRVSVTDLDAFLFWKRSEDASLEDLLARLRRESPPSEEMLAGIAFHSALEHAIPGTFSRLDRDGYTFLFETSAALELTEFRELKAEKVYVIDGEPVEVVGKVDGLHGKRVDDHKTTGRFDPDRYFDSYQWRFYLDIFGADQFRWNVFELREEGDRHYAVFNAHPIEQWRYPGMRQDCERLLREFLHFARVHLPERFAVAEAA